MRRSQLSYDLTMEFDSHASQSTFTPYPPIDIPSSRTHQQRVRTYATNNGPCICCEN